MASENTQFGRLLCTVLTFMAFFNYQRKDLGDPSCSSCPDAVWDAHVKTYLIIHLPDIVHLLELSLQDVALNACVEVMKIALVKAGSHKSSQLPFSNGNQVVAQSLLI